MNTAVQYFCEKGMVNSGAQAKRNAVDSLDSVSERDELFDNRFIDKAPPCLPGIILSITLDINRVSTLP